MREILFRGKRIDNGEWIYGYFSKHTTGKTFIRPSGKNCQYSAEVLPETVGQYTGLTDKNGTKIFEGDILNVNNEYIGVVGYAAGAFGAKYTDGKGAIYLCYVNEYSEVIGNIHDNPELLNN